MKFTIVLLFAFLAVSFALNHRLKETVLAEAEEETEFLCGWILAPCGTIGGCCYGLTCDTWWNGDLGLFLGVCK